MSTQFDLSDEADVYSKTPLAESGVTLAPLAHPSIALSLECSPLTLSRVYGLVGTVSMVPTLSRTTIGDDGIIDIFIEFADVDARKFELLCRKLNQLTEIVDCWISTT